LLSPTTVRYDSISNFNSVQGGTFNGFPTIASTKFNLNLTYTQQITGYGGSFADGYYTVSTIPSSIPDTYTISISPNSYTISFADTIISSIICPCGTTTGSTSTAGGQVTKSANSLITIENSYTGDTTNAGIRSILPTTTDYNYKNKYIPNILTSTTSYGDGNTSGFIRIWYIL
jgi:hypothetical protein